MFSRIKKDNRVAVVGAGASGLAASRLLLQQGFHVCLLERKEEGHSEELLAFIRENNVEFIVGPHMPEHFAPCEMIVTSPGVPLKSLMPTVAASAAFTESGKAPVVISELELALPLVTAPIIALTGTSGKTTTVSLVAAMLERSGKKVFLGGNIGVPLCTHAQSGEHVDVVVLECSSFQLSTTKSLHAKVAVLLNLTENHLDQHTDMREYTDAKFSIFENQTVDDLAIIPPSFLEEYRQRGYKARVLTFEDNPRFDGMQIEGGHNRANAQAAFMASQFFGVTEAQALEAAMAFAPLRHRLEKVGEHKGVAYVNDSKSTTVDSLRVALESYTRPVILLAGGTFKGGDLRALGPVIAEKVKAIFLYGGSRTYFEHAWQGVKPMEWNETLDDAFAAAGKQASPGDVVLLSPATSSYDQYKHYIERGNHFCRLVKELP